MKILKKWWFWSLATGLISLGIGGWWMISERKITLLNPLGDYREEVKAKSSYKIVGFLPTWMVGKTQDYSEEVNRLVFLGIEADEKGNLIWDGQSKKINSDDYIKIKNEIRSRGGKNIVGIKLFEDEKLTTLLADETAKKNLIEQIKEVVVTGNFDGVNIDFEFMGDPTAVLEEETYGFVKALKESGVGEVSLDVFANTVIKGNKENLERIVNELDSLVVMAYDFHRPGSDYVGPVAPIKSQAGERNILEVVTRVVDDNLDKKKIILAFPLYGYEWKTETADFGARAKKGWSAMASYKRVKELLSSGVATEQWDEESMTPWIAYVDEGANKQIYYENLQSLSLKFNLVKTSQLGGVGFWALGYEGENRDVWEEVEKVLGN